MKRFNSFIVKLFIKELNQRILTVLQVWIKNYVFPSVLKVYRKTIILIIFSWQNCIFFLCTSTITSSSLLIRLNLQIFIPVWHNSLCYCKLTLRAFSKVVYRPRHFILRPLPLSIDYSHTIQPSLSVCDDDGNTSHPPEN